MHTAIIPARMGSVGFKFKNRRFFGNTADFLDEIPWMDRVVVSTNDPEVKTLTDARGYVTHHRSEALSGPAVSIKAVFSNVISDLDMAGSDRLWLFFLPVLYKNLSDFQAAKAIVDTENPESLCTFIPVKTHPYDCWSCDAQTGQLSQYIPNTVYRRQDKPPAWEHYHYVYNCLASSVPSLNDELLNADTRPIFYDQEKSAKLVEVDTPEDFKRWQQIQSLRESP